MHAAGDVTGSHQHTPAAWYEGRLAAENALRGNRRAVDFSLFPTATMTNPAGEQIGLTEAAARQQGVMVPGPELKALGVAPLSPVAAWPSPPSRWCAAR